MQMICSKYEGEKQKITEVVQTNGVHKVGEASKKTCQRWIHVRVYKDACKWQRFVGMYSLKKRYTMSRNSKTLYYWGIIEQVNDHIHANSPTQVELKKIEVGMKYKAKRTEETVQHILGKQLRDISENAVANLSSIATMRWNIWKARGYDNIPQTPLNPEGTLVLPNKYQLTKYREPFLMFDSGEEDPKRILASEIGIHILSESEH